VGIGGNLYPLSLGINPDANYTGWRVFWEYADDPLNSGPTGMTAVNPEHASVAHSSYGCLLFETLSASYSCNPADYLNLPLPVAVGKPTFNGVGANDGSQLYVETHPSLSVTNPASQSAFRHSVDGAPFYGDLATVTAGMVTLVGGTGQLYRIHGSPVGANYKLIPYFGSTGYHAMRETSGPGVTMTTDSSTQYRFCVVYVAGECYSGSSAGDVYFNAPSVMYAYCNNDNGNLINGFTINRDICLSPSSAAVQVLEDVGLSSDPYGLQFRAIAHGLFSYKDPHLGAYWNTRTIPDGSWALTINSADDQIKLFKIPPVAAMRIDGTGYVSYPVTIPATVDPILVEFGYAENGDPATSLNCTARNEPCVAVASTIGTPPLWFKTSDTGSYSGASCTIGCTVAIPAFPGRTLYYRVVVGGTPGPTHSVALGMATPGSVNTRGFWGRGAVIGRGTVR
jgi:hypothetical protein